MLSIYAYILCYNFSLLVLVCTCLCMVCCVGRDAVVFTAVLCKLLVCVYLMLVVWCVVVGVILMYFNYVRMFLL
jgi:hypothetical protein